MRRAAILKSGKENIVYSKHPWIFSGAIESLPSIDPGEILPLCQKDGKILGFAYFHPKNSLAGRIVSWGDGDPIQTMKSSLETAIQFRKEHFDPSITNCYRLVNGEGDFLPGLIIDRYGDFLSLQIHTCGMEKIKPTILQWLIEFLQPKAIYEKSAGHSRRQEGLKDSVGLLYGNGGPLVDVLENGMHFTVDLVEGQKTGFFIDQRDNRQKIEEISCNKKVLNCFSYSGGFSLYALRGGAKEVTSVDVSSTALELAKKNTELNRFSQTKHHLIKEDVLHFLAVDPLEYDLIILDPPAFAKKKQDIPTASRAYQRINSLVMKKVKKGTLLLTCSCSYYIDDSTFQKVIERACDEADRFIQLIGKHLHPLDHPVSLHHPEGDYLKSMLLRIC